MEEGIGLAAFSAPWVQAGISLRRKRVSRLLPGHSSWIMIKTVLQGALG